MAETPSNKRSRQEVEVEKEPNAQQNDFLDEEGEVVEAKRQKSFTQILSILEEDEDEGNTDLSSLVSHLQEELSCDSSIYPGSDDVILPENPSSSGEEDQEGVFRHLLEASDDELGIPRVEMRFEDDGFDGGDGFSSFDGFWELEDEAANYYTLLQSELFM